MNSLKSILMVAAIAFAVINVQAQDKKMEAKPATKKETKAAPAKGEAKKSDAKSAPKAAATEKAEVKKDGRTKTGDPVNHSMKGPKGETVYSGPKGGFYYLDKDDKKVYMNQQK